MSITLKISPSIHRIKKYTMPASKLTDEQLALARTYLTQFQSASKKDRANLIQQVAHAVIGLKPSAKEREKKELKKVRRINPDAGSSRLMLLQTVKTWLFNNGRQREGRKLTQLRKYTWRHVVAHLKKAELEGLVRELSSAEPGTSAYFSKYQAGLRTICDELTDDEVDEYKALVKTWNEETPPKKIQSR